MLGQAVYGRGAMTQEFCRGMRYYRIYLPQKGLLAHYLRKRQWKLLRKKGVRYAIFPRELAQEAATCGIRPMSAAPLRQALLGQLITRGTCARLRAKCVDRAVEQAAVLLQRRYRYVLLDIEQGKERLAQMLYLRFGVSGTASAAPEVTVSFCDEVPSGRTVCLGEKCAEYQTVTYEIAGEGEKTSEEGWICSLFLAGSLKKEEICVKSISFNA